MSSVIALLVAMQLAGPVPDRRTIEFYSELRLTAVRFELLNVTQRRDYNLIVREVRRTSSSIWLYRQRLPRSVAAPGDVLMVRACYRNTSICSEWTDGVRMPGVRLRRS